VTQVNLLPREVKQRQVTRRRTGLIAVLGALVVGGIIALWFLQGVRLQKLDDQVAAQEAANATLQAEVDKLQKFADQKANLDQRKAVLQSALVNTVEWSNVLDTLSRIEPDTMWLSSLSGTVTAPSAAPAEGTVPPPGTTETPAADLIGSIQFQGNALDSSTISLWLTELEAVKGWVNPWVSSAQKADVTGTEVWQFNSSVDLDSRAARKGGPQ
jgi:Tfp pilus assembly protein PilN